MVYEVHAKKDLAATVGGSEMHPNAYIVEMNLTNYGWQICTGSQ